MAELRNGDFFIGDPDLRGHTSFPTGVRRDAASVRELLLKSRVPTQWWPHCDVSTGTDESGGVNGSINLRVGGIDPPRAVSELHQAVSLGLGLSLQPQEGLDLADIGEPLLEAARLSIGGLRHVTGWSVLSRSRAQRLVVGGASELLPALPELRWFVGGGSKAAGALRSPHLRVFSIDLAGEAWPAGVSALGPVESLQIMGARRLTSIPALAEPTALRTFRVDRAGTLDLEALTNATELEWVDLSRVGSVTSFAVLANVRELERLELAGVREIDDWEWMGKSSIATVIIERNRVIPDSLAATWKGQHPGWVIDRRLS